MVFRILRTVTSAECVKQSANNVAKLVDDAANTIKQATDTVKTPLKLKPVNKAAENLGLAEYRSEVLDGYVWGRQKNIFRMTTEGRTSHDAECILNYRNRVLGMPEGQVVTRSGKVYTRTMGRTGERIYTDANGNRIVLNDHRNQFCWQPEQSTIYRTSPNGSEYSISVTKRKNEQEAVRYVCNKPESTHQMDLIKINNQGKVLEHRVESSTPNSLQGCETRFGCSQNGGYMYNSWIRIQGTTQSPPQFTSLNDFIYGF